MNKNKKLISIIAVVCLFVVAVVAGASSAWKSSSSKSELVSGTFEGTAQGLGGDVVVTLTLEDNVITDVKAVGANETDGIGTKALDKLPGEIVAGNTLSVDSVSGATITSEAIVKAAEAALASAGLTAADLVAVEHKDTAAAEDIEAEADVVIVGAGGAGLTAAITAADAGKTVIVVESQDVAGGNSVRSTGGMNASETEFENENEWNAAGEETALEKTLKNARETYADNADVQALADKVAEQYEEYKKNPEGYFDSVELMELDTMVGGKAVNDLSLVETLAANSASAIEWVNGQAKEADPSNSGLVSVGQFGGASVKRIHRPVDADGKTVSVGAYVMPILEKNLASRNITVYYNTTATEILMKDGAAVGIAAEGKDGNKVTVNAKSVILATGGFGANNDMVAELNSALKGYITTNAVGAQGQGITMATADSVGAATVDMEQIQLHPTVHVDEGGNAHLITEGLRGDGAILVNKEGLRFTNEVGTRDVVSAAENDQTDGMAWLIVDQEMVDASKVIQGYINNGYTVQGETAADLAAAMEVDADALTETLNKWNECVNKQEDAEFGRTSFVKTLGNGTLYALTVQPGIHHTMGGLAINTKTEVLNTSGNVIPGLFAAGEVTGGVHGANRLGGNAVADFIVFGRIAGDSAAAYAK